MARGSVVVALAALAACASGVSAGASDAIVAACEARCGHLGDAQLSVTDRARHCDPMIGQAPYPTVHNTCEESWNAGARALCRVQCRQQDCSRAHLKNTWHDTRDKYCEPMYGKMPRPKLYHVCQHAYDSAQLPTCQAKVGSAILDEEEHKALDKEMEEPESEEDKARRLQAEAAAIEAEARRRAAELDAARAQSAQEVEARRLAEAKEAELKAEEAAAAAHAAAEAEAKALAEKAAAEKAAAEKAEAEARALKEKQEAEAAAAKAAAEAEAARAAEAEAAAKAAADAAAAQAQQQQQQQQAGADKNVRG